MAITEGLAASKAGFELLKSLREILKRPTVDAGEINARLLELQDFMLDTKNALGDAQEENRKLNLRLSQVEANEQLTTRLKFEWKVYWLDTVAQGYPYCPLCWDCDKKLVHLIDKGMYSKGKYFDCPVHNVRYSLSLKDPSVSFSF